MRRTLSNSQDNTRTFTYIVPLLELPKRLIIDYCVDAYCGDVNRPEYNKPYYISLLFEYFDDPIDIKIEREFNKLPNFIESYKVNEKQIMYVFSLHPKYEKDFDTFLKSKYSELSVEAKKTIRKFFDLNPTKTVYGILYKTELRKQELERYLSYHPSGRYLGPTIIPEHQEYESVLDMDNEVYGSKQLNIELLIQ